MNGTMLTISPDSERAATRELTAPPALVDLQTAVGGYIEMVPGFSVYAHVSGLRPCVVYCNEEGKLHGLPYNAEATRLWLLSLGISAETAPDHLVGSIVILFGDDDFMEAL